jgi:diaminopimelate decarboxylase
MYEAYHAVVNVSRYGGAPDSTYTVAGNICETGDILAEDRPLPASEDGDLLAICDTGAYGMTMASNYNRRSLPSEVLLDANAEPQLIRQRETPEQIVNRFLKESFF